MRIPNKNIAIAASTLLLSILDLFCFAQKKFNDTSTISEVVVTATRTEKSIGDIPVPIQVISRKFIQQTGSQKLIDILQQQTGMILANNPLGQALQGYPNPFGSGIQLQGLDPAYTLILIDGEPLTGRNAGILNLDRIAIGNIRQIEIVKGPASSLYGSDALAGVINILTEKPTTPKSYLQFHRASNNTWGITSSANLSRRKASLQLFGTRYSTNGYDLDNSVYGKTVDPYRNYSFSVKSIYEWNSRTQLSSSARIFTQKQFNNYLAYTGNLSETVEGSTNETDWSFNNRLQQVLNKTTKLFTSIYITGYRDNAEVFLQKDHSLFDRSWLHQFLLKPEIQLETGKSKNEKFITGIGYNYETIDASRYAAEKKLNAFYGYAQKEWLPLGNLNITLGARLDKHSLYKAQFNPKLALAWKPVEKITLIASAGSGFKAPDFRQQFLYFTNSVVGYTLLGANELNNGLLRMKQEGQIDPAIDLSPYLTDHSLLPERSVGINIGMRCRVNNNMVITTGVFRNDINNLIDRYNLPFTKTNNQSIYSYINVNRVFTRGFDISINQKLNNLFTLNAGYQYLDAKDKTVLQNIREGKLVKRDPVTFNSSYVREADYGGLFNRSKHTANLQLGYSNKHHWLNWNLRANYRGRFGYNDINGDNILDDEREYVKSYVLLNSTAGIVFRKGFEIQAGVENILNHINKDKLPYLSGRLYFINCNIDLINITNKNKTTNNNEKDHQ